MLCLALVPFGNADEVAALAVVVLVVAGWTGVRLAGTRTDPETRPVRVRRVRVQHRLSSRSWLEMRDDERTYWLPVYFDPALIALPSPTAGTAGARVVTVDGRRFLASGRPRSTEPVGRLIDNPSRSAPDATARGLAANHIGRRLLLDAQSAVGAPLLGVLWVFVAGGGIAAFAGATIVGACAAIWWSAIGGSDPS
ncbi:hypothetical protein OG921_03530 [Aldersonia sp. NBC_00410]|nr:hypothetical protein [Aldersonia sp. NBC_00410]